MTRARQTTWRQIAAELALLALVVFSTLVPWHNAVRALASGLGSQSEKHALCSAGPVTETADEQPPPGGHGGLDCPVCSGLAGLSFAIASSVVAVDFPAISRLAPHVAASANGDGAASETPRNRGPPRQI